MKLRNRTGQCRGCGNSNDNEEFRCREMFLGSRQSFSYVLCNKCKSLSIMQIPVNLDDLYRGYYSFKNEQLNKPRVVKNLCRRLVLSHPRSLGRFLSLFLRDFDDLKIKALAPYIKSKDCSILDVGCGIGTFLDEVRELGFCDLLGIDPFLSTDQLSKRGVQLLRAKPDYIKRKYEIVTLHHVYEHMENPLEGLKSIKNLLTEGGVAIIRIPNIESYSFRKFRASWEGIHAPYHFFLPSARCLSDLATRAGLEIIETRFEQKVSLFLNSVAHSLDISDYDPLGPRNFYEKRAASLKRTPPLFMHSEMKYWRKKQRHVVKIGMADWIVHYLTRRPCT